MNSNQQVIDKKHKYCKICRRRQPSKIEDSNEDTDGTFVDFVRTTAKPKKYALCVTEKDLVTQTTSLNAYLIKQ